MKPNALAKSRLSRILPALILAALGMQGCEGNDSEYDKYVNNNEVSKCSFNLMSLNNGKYIRKVESSFYCGDYNTVGLNETPPTTATCTDIEINKAKEAMAYGNCVKEAFHCVPQLAEGGVEKDNAMMCSEYDAGLINCGGKSVDIKNDVNHCGKCGEKCDGGKCIDGVCAEITSCANNQISCYCKGRECVKPKSDGGIPDGYVASDLKCFDHTSNAFCGISTECNLTEVEECSTGQFCDTKTNKCITKTVCADNEVACFCNGEQCKPAPRKLEDAVDAPEGYSFLCLKPSDNATCNVQANCEITDANRCTDGRVCTGSGESYSCECLENYIDNVDSDGNHKCLDPKSNDSCGATTSEIGKKCDDKVSICDGTTCKCLSNAIDCNDNCISDLTSNENCGGCGILCGKNETCVNGVCTCDDGFAYCDKGCVEIDNTKYCGAKGACNSPDENSENYMGKKCTNTETCKRQENGVYDCVCNNLSLEIDGECIDPNTNNKYCGAIDKDSYPNDVAGRIYYGNCDEKLAGSFCSNGKCSCPTNQIIKQVDNDKYECINYINNSECCGMDCINCIEQGKICNGESCNSACSSDMIRCGNHCLKPKNENPEKDQESDHVILIDASTNTCKCDDTGSHIYCADDGDVTNGCHTTAGTLENCGGCTTPEDNHVCRDGFNVCKSGITCGCLNGEECYYTNNTYKEEADANDENSVLVCLNLNNVHMKSCIECELGWANFDGDIANGCETDISSNVENCGVVGNNCNQKVENAIGVSCHNSMCDYAVCSDASFGDCDNDRKNGCEKDLTSTETNCGYCGIVCETGGCEDSKCCYKDNNSTKDSLTCCSGYNKYKHTSSGWPPECWFADEYYGCYADNPGSCWEIVN